MHLSAGCSPDVAGCGPCMGQDSGERFGSRFKRIKNDLKGHNVPG